ncbi:hypothetical protein [Helicobacter pylori]|uniref:hypothetical protein n=1 Tax=Helicobacter pylori TaxID=210 RepID=UPI001BB43A84|nr:hypothetical protein [Helicobacter pylori]
MRPIIETINPKNAKKILGDLLGLNEVLQKRVFKQQLSKLALQSLFLIAEYGAA